MSSIKNYEEKDSSESMETSISTSRSSIMDLYAVMKWKIPRAILIYLGILLTASAYSNLQPLSFMLTKMGAYVWLCEEGETECDEQSLYIESMYNIGANMEYVVGFVAGFTLDIIGAQWTASLGIGLCTLGWIFFACSSQSAQLYWPAFILLGGACNLIGFPGFLVGNFFRGWTHLGASLCISMQMLSSFCMQGMWMIADKVDPELIKYIFVGYIATYAAPAAGMIISLPSRKYLKKPTIPEEDFRKKAYWVIYLRYLVEWRFLLFTAWYILLTMCYSVYNTSVRRHAGDDVAALLGILNPVRAILGPLQGALADKIGIYPVFFLNNGLVSAFFILALFQNSEGAQYTAVVVYIIGRSFVFTTKYCFVLQFYPEEHFGKLSGFLSLLSGLFGFLVSVIINIDKPTEYMFSVFLIISVLMAGIPITLFVTRNKTTGATVVPKIIDSVSVSSDEESEVVAVPEFLATV